MPVKVTSIPRQSSALVLLLVCTACAPKARLTFPADGRRDFELRYDKTGRADALLYDDDEDGRVDRTYPLARLADASVPHFVLLLDSVPFEVMRERYASGHFRFMSPPAKVIPPFPTLTEVCYTKVLGCPPLSGVTDRYFDRSSNKVRDHLMFRVRNPEPWEQKLDYRESFVAGNLTYTNPRPWLESELEQARQTFDADTDRRCVAYVISASGMACKYGREGIEEVLDQAERLCLQILYERRGAVRISVMADHGHNLVPCTNVPLEPALRSGGFRVSDHLYGERDVVIELCALVNYVGLHTRKPAEVASSLVGMKEVELAMYVAGESVVVRSKEGEAAIDCVEGRYRYRAITGDVLHYSKVMAELAKKGRVSADGFAGDDVLLAATADHVYPDALKRVWEAFHGEVINTPDVMVTLHDGYYAGLSSLERFITMKSTHGSLNQQNSATFVMTMGAELPGVLRSEQVMGTIK